MRNKKHALILFLVFIALLYLCFKEQLTSNPRVNLSSSQNDENCGVYGCIDENFDFEGFDNENGSEKMIVPNIVHLVYLKASQVKFYQVIGIFSIYFNHKPDLIYIHCDNCSFYGKYWEWIKAEPDLWKIIKIHKVEIRDTVFRRKFGYIEHSADVLRIQMLMNYGGIYLDNDMYVVNSLDKYRHYEMTISWDSRDVGLGNQIFIAHRNARFLKTYYDSYRYNYTSNKWYWSAGLFPTEILKDNNEYLVHSVKHKLGTHMLVGKLYKSYWPDWKTYDCLHLLINHRNYLDKESPIKEFDEFNIRDYNYTYGYMVRAILQKLKKI